LLRSGDQLRAVAQLVEAPGGTLITSQTVQSSLGDLFRLQDDPEAIFQVGWLLCDVGEYATGLEQLQMAVAKGYTVAPTLAGSRQFDAMRNDPAFQALLAQAEAGRRDALAYDAAWKTRRYNGTSETLISSVP
jgi:hypothetical protein